MSDCLSDFFDEPELAEDDLFAIFESLDSVTDFPPATLLDETVVSSYQEEKGARLASQKSTSSSILQESETELETSPKSKRQKINNAATNSSDEALPDGQQRMSHITVERNRRKQMNEHLSVLRSLMPCFYVKRGDQASIIGGVVDYINELQQVLQSLEAKKQRKVYSEVLSPRIVSSPRPLPLSPRKPPLSPRLNLPISPRTPQPGSPYRPRLQQGYLSPTKPSSVEPSPCSSSTSSIDSINELVANSKSAIADVEVKFSGPNVLLKTVSPRIPGQAGKIIAALEDLSLEILNVNINTLDETMLNSFTIKIGIECQLSAEELAQQIQQTFC
ncbi:hypothetical protein Patl1_20307 [Pistacia atlantica]|uniref:Uncharacterized protein n=1 Tax=Pistacia atlantica TaxID=434234 RepID=A0ACC1BJB5_9ROSI|nr:hypothetical protein Patl1_20307 [Pistacia atlantica]